MASAIGMDTLGQYPDCLGRQGTFFMRPCPCKVGWQTLSTVLVAYKTSALHRVIPFYSFFKLPKWYKKYPSDKSSTTHGYFIANLLEYGILPQSIHGKALPEPICFADVFNTALHV